MPTHKKTKIRQINLVPEEGLSSTTAGRVLLWILSTFRVLLIVTEVVVIGAFISRFWLDAKNTDLNEEIKSKSSLILSFSDFEKKFKNTQQKLSLFTEYKKGAGAIVLNLKKLISYKPEGIVFRSIDAHPETLKIEAVAINEIVVHQYLINLNSSEYFNSITIGDVFLNNDRHGIKFSLSAEIVNPYNL